ncbi:uncharacterized protein PAC_06278 [Phialocephala subalpina]|uniref:D-serine dehydratase-like domain-containing protein n=1 Tax=Phialocephala subalpina TaxID=576137 RepID=A0A1L7WUH6_9HELO|nr:uncharacterized protein PAC_06278 [Phialocephala subalpina]
MAGTWPLRTKASLVEQFVGKTLDDIRLPAAVLDIAKVKHNCKRMLDAVEELGFDFLPAVSYHKTTEITRLQLGDDAEEVRVLVTSLWEAAKLLPLLLEYQINGKQVNVLYGAPISPSQVEAAADISRQLGRRGGNIRFLVDCISQVDLVERVGRLSGYPPFVYILVDVGDQFSGVRPGTPEFQELFSRIEQIALGQGLLSMAFVGFFSDIPFPSEQVDLISHMRHLDRQMTTLLHASPVEIIRLSVHAPPGLWYLLQRMEGPLSREVSKIEHTLAAANQANDAIEVHSGEYVLLDVRSVIQDSLAVPGTNPCFTYSDIALTILTEISSLYPRRGEKGHLEALISLGGSAFHTGDGPLQKGVLSEWNMGSIEPKSSPPLGWTIDRCHGDSAVLVWRDENSQPQSLECGQRVRIYPNDAKYAGKQFGWYYVVDSSRDGKEDEIVDIFVRWRG